jgi:hypothetical protein
MNDKPRRDDMRIDDKCLSKVTSIAASTTVKVMRQICRTVKENGRDAKDWIRLEGDTHNIEQANYPRAIGRTGRT